MQMQTKVSELATDQNTQVQLIIFLAGDEEFGVSIEEAREIIKMGMVTPIPDAPNFIRGIVNVRGEIVTAIDIKKLFKLPETDKAEPKHIVVTKQKDGLFGLIVDEVIEVFRIQKNAIKEPPAIVPNVQKKYINGVISHNNRLIILLDLTKILAQKELQKLSWVTKKSKTK